MTWTRLDDHFTTHPKIVSLSRDAGWLFVAALVYCNANLTDGFVPEAMLPALAKSAVREGNRFAKQLVDAGLWTREGTGYRVNNFLKWNQPASEVKAKREAASARVAKHRSKRDGREMPPTYGRDSGEMGGGYGGDTDEMRRSWAEDARSKTANSEPKSDVGNASVTSNQHAPVTRPSPVPSSPVPYPPSGEENSSRTHTRGRPDPEEAPRAQAIHRGETSLPDGYADMILAALREGGAGKVETQAPVQTAANFVRLCRSADYTPDDLRTLGEFLASGKAWAKRDRFDLGFLSGKDGSTLAGLVSDARGWREKHAPRNPPDEPPPTGGQKFVNPYGPRRASLSPRLQTALANAQQAKGEPKARVPLAS